MTSRDTYPRMARWAARPQPATAVFANEVNAALDEIDVWRSTFEQAESDRGDAHIARTHAPKGSLG